MKRPVWVPSPVRLGRTIPDHPASLSLAQTSESYRLRRHPVRGALSLSPPPPLYAGCRGFYRSLRDHAPVFHPEKAKMIKRRYFRQDHGDNSGSSSSSSSGSDSDNDPTEEAVSSEEVEEDQEEEAVREESGEEEEEDLEQKIEEESSGYQSEENSGNDVDDSSIDDDEHSSARNEERHEISLPIKKSSGAIADSAKSADNTDDAVDADFPDCILKCKSVFKCKLCPRIICLNEEMVKIHLKSKRHARSKKLLGEGRLKLMLNSDGELEEEQETHAERHARTIAISQQVQKPKKDSGRQRQNRRKKKRSRNNLEKKQEAQNSNKKQRKAK